MDSLFRFAATFSVLCVLAPLLLRFPGHSLAAVGPLHTSGRWILDASNKRFKMRCVNWAGHGEVNIPEGLQHQPVDWIAGWIADNGFNCVRLTYSIDMALNPSLPAPDSFTAAATAGGVPAADMQRLYGQAVGKNPFLANATVLDAFSAVISSLGDRGLAVVLDNHVSRASWCCSDSDGNGWWDEADGFVPANSRFFNTTDWLAGLAAMARYAADPERSDTVVGLSLRNELRASDGQDADAPLHSDWHRFVAAGARAIHAANPGALIVIGGPASATDLSFIPLAPLAEIDEWPGRTVWEFHSYGWTFPGVTAVCPAYDAALDSRSGGFLLTEGFPWTGPLWLSEFGFAQLPPSPADADPRSQFLYELEQRYLACLVSYMERNDADWAVWALQGSYYLRQGIVEYDESYGVMNAQWTGFRNPDFKSKLGGMFDVTQGP